MTSDTNKAFVMEAAAMLLGGAAGCRLTWLAPHNEPADGGRRRLSILPAPQIVTSVQQKERHGLNSVRGFTLTLTILLWFRYISHHITAGSVMFTFK